MATLLHGRDLCKKIAKKILVISVFLHFDSKKVEYMKCETKYLNTDERKEKNQCGSICL